MTDPMDLVVSFFHENGNLARARELREALNQFEMRMPERIGGRILSRLPVEERAPSGWSRFQRLADFRTTGFHGLGWERREQDSGELMEWVGFGWYHDRSHDYLLDPQDRPGDPSRWIGWWRLGIEHQSRDEAQLFEKVRIILGERLASPVEQGLFDSEAQHAGGWPYFHGAPAAEGAGALRVDTDEFATASSKLLLEIRRAVEQIG